MACSGGYDAIGSLIGVGTLVRKEKFNGIMDKEGVTAQPLGAVRHTVLLSRNV